MIYFTYLISNILKAHTAGIKGGSLLGIAHPKSDVIEAEEVTDLGLKT